MKEYHPKLRKEYALSGELLDTDVGVVFWLSLTLYVLSVLFVYNYHFIMPAVWCAAVLTQKTTIKEHITLFILGLFPGMLLCMSLNKEMIV